MNDLTEHDILTFISTRFPADCHWTDGNCYWFAHILSTEFPFLHIYYDSAPGHFIAGTPSHYYDWHGRYIPCGRPILLTQLQQDDPLWYSHLMRDCRD